MVAEVETSTSTRPMIMGPGLVLSLYSGLQPSSPCARHPCVASPEGHRRSRQK